MSFQIPWILDHQESPQNTSKTTKQSHPWNPQGPQQKPEKKSHLQNIYGKIKDHSKPIIAVSLNHDLSLEQNENIHNNKLHWKQI